MAANDILRGFTENITVDVVEKYFVVSVFLLITQCPCTPGDVKLVMKNIRVISCSYNLFSQMYCHFCWENTMACVQNVGIISA